MASINFGNDELNQHAKASDMFDVKSFPEAHYKGKLANFNGDIPSKVDGILTLRGVAKPLTLDILSFKCIQHPLLGREACGADAVATLNRADFGIDFGLNTGFKPEVKLEIQVVGVRAE